MPAFGVVDGVQQGTVEVAHTAPYYFFGKDECFALGCAIPFGLNSRQMTAWMYEGNGLKLMREFYAKYNIINFPGGNTGAQMGGWFRKEIKSLEGPQGPEVPHRRLRRQGARAHRRRAAEHPRRRNLPRAGKGHDRRGRVGGPVRRPEARLQQGRAVLLLPRLVGRRPASWTSSSTRRPTTRCRPRTRPSSRPPPRTRTSTCRPGTTRVNPVALKQLVGAGTKLRPFPAGHDDRRVQGSHGPVRASSTPRTRAGRRSTRTTRKFRADQNLWFRFTEMGFDRFMQSQKL